MQAIPALGHPPAELPLSSLVVLDLTLARAGPTCVRHLSDWGADVIRIEPPSSGGGEDMFASREDFDFQNLHRNKRAITLDLKTEEGHAVFMRLAGQADVVVENMRASVKHRLGISYEDVRQVNPRLIYASISGFGQDGPYGQRAGVDQIAQGMGGLMSITGAPGQGPMRVGIPIADLTAGNLLALGISIALLDRERTGQGRWVTTSLLEAQLFMLDFQATRWLMAGEVAKQAGNDHPTIIPMGVFPASDGAINIAVSSGKQWAMLCGLLDHSDWMERPDWQTHTGRSANRAAIHAAIAGVTRLQPAAHWIKLFEDAGIPCGPIYAIDEVFDDPQVKHLRMVREVEHPTLGMEALVASPLNLSGYEKDVRTPTPGRGEHTDQILRQAGYNDGEIAALREKCVLG